MKCQHCQRRIVEREGVWIDPMATGDDAVWRTVCEAHDTFTADHEPEPVPTPFRADNGTSRRSFERIDFAAQWIGLTGTPGKTYNVVNIETGERFLVTPDPDGEWLHIGRMAKVG